MANIAVPDNPVFRLDIEETTEETPGSYEEFNSRFAKFLENDVFLKNAIGRESEVKQLPAGETTVVFEFDIDSIKDNSTINVYASEPGVDYTSIEMYTRVQASSVSDITTHWYEIEVTFEPQEKDIDVKVVVADGVVSNP